MGHQADSISDVLVLLWKVTDTQQFLELPLFIAHVPAFFLLLSGIVFVFLICSMISTSFAVGKYDWDIECALYFYISVSHFIWLL